MHHSFVVFFTAPRYASAVGPTCRPYAEALCPSVCPSVLRGHRHRS